MTSRICLLGSGNVASHLARALNQVGEIVQVYSRRIDNARRLAQELGGDVAFTDDTNAITPDADFYIIAVRDDAIESLVASTPNAGVWAHTSGSVPMSVFEGRKTHFGVFYPLQTFSRDVDLDLSKVPFFIEGSDEQTYAQLFALASKISEVVEPADSQRRCRLHVAAVFACNFVNFMWMQADDLLKADNLGIDYLRPLLEETLRKISTVSPADAQTGPARRGDTDIINRHLAMLQGNSREIYERLSNDILKTFNPQ